jgi:tRNA(Arg) A34 adenosine deaminase TadA
MLTLVGLSHLRRAIEFAGAACAHGNHPFGALLVDPTGEVLAEAKNSVVTDLDCTAHAELNLIKLASHKYDAVTLAASALYASTDPSA